MNDVFASLNRWIKANKLALNFDKTNFMKFCTNNKTCVNLNMGFDDKTIEEYRYNFHVQNSNLSKYQKGVYYSGIKIFNNLPPNVKNLSHNIKVFKRALKEYHLSHSFYSVEEFTLAKNSQLT
jgi:hypothetical protein